METLVVARGLHEDPSQGRCAAAWVAYLAGEPHTDHPECMDPLLGEFLRWLNDELPYRERQKLVPYLPRMIGTRDDGRQVYRRNMMYVYGRAEAFRDTLQRPVRRC
jgi:hypothetical protein